MNVSGLYKGFLFITGFFFLMLDGFNQTPSQAYGLQFSSHEAVPEKRTSLVLTGKEPICFSKQLDLAFDLNFLDDHITYFGYIFRLINDKGQNIDLLYDQKSSNFRVVAGENFTDISFQLNDELLKRDWNRLEFSVETSGKLTCKVGTHEWHSNGVPLKSKCFTLVFGSCNEHNFVSRDLPPMRLRNVELKEDGELRSYWPLSESAGPVATDSLGNWNGKVENAVWIKPKHEVWGKRSYAYHARSPQLCFRSGEGDRLYCYCRYLI